MVTFTQVPYLSNLNKNDKTNQSNQTKFKCRLRDAS